MISLPRLYAIVDTSRFPHFEAALTAAEEVMAAGVTVIQYRDKFANAAEILRASGELRPVSRGC